MRRQANILKFEPFIALVGRGTEYLSDPEAHPEDWNMAIMDGSVEPIEIYFTPDKIGYSELFVTGFHFSMEDGTRRFRATGFGSSTRALNRGLEFRIEQWNSQTQQWESYLEYPIIKIKRNIDLYLIGENTPPDVVLGRGTLRINIVPPFDEFIYEFGSAMASNVKGVRINSSRRIALIVNDNMTRYFTRLGKFMLIITGIGVKL